MIRGSSLRSWVILIVSYRIKSLEYRPSEKFQRLRRMIKKLFKKK